MLTVTRNKPNKNMQDQWEENYKTLLMNVNEKINKWRDIRFLDGKTKFFKDDNPSLTYE